MPVTFKILKDRSLVYIRISGTARADESFEAFSRYATDADFRPSQHQLIDLTHVMDVEQDYPELMKMQARKADVLVGSGSEVLVVYLAPTPVTLELATTILKSWVGVEGVVARIAQHEDQALDILGQSEKSINALLKVGS